MADRPTEPSSDGKILTSTPRSKGDSGDNVDKTSKSKSKDEKKSNNNNKKDSLVKQQSKEKLTETSSKGTKKDTLVKQKSKEKLSETSKKTDIQRQQSVEKTTKEKESKDKKSREKSDLKDKNDQIDKKTKKASVNLPEIDENGNEKEKDEEEEEEEGETEMTQEEKEEMYFAVKNGDFHTLHECLDKRNVDLNMTWFKENLLMTAIRAGQTEVAEFLIDIGINYNHTIKYFHLRESEKKGKRIDTYEKSCRDLAYDLGNDHIVEIIDVKNKNVFPFVPIKPRHIWTMRPPAPPIPKHMLPKEEQIESEDDSDDEDDRTDSGHQSARSQEKTTEQSFSEMLDKLNGTGKDDGYGTLSPCLSPYLGHFSPHVYVPPEKPLVYHKATKASMALQSHNDQCYKRRVPSKSAPTVRNVKAVGSYALEKQQWHTGITRERSSLNNETISIKSLPFGHSYSSAPGSRRPSAQASTSSPVAEVTKILGQSAMLRRDSNSSRRSTQCGVIPSQKINQRCHTNNVFNRLSKSAQQRKIGGSNFPISREFSRHNRW